jgi:hypothetical protein
MQVAEDDDSGGERNARIRYTPTRAGEFMVVCTSFSGGVGAYHLHVEKVTGPRPPDRPPVGEAVLNVKDELRLGDPKDRVRTESFAKEHKVEMKVGVKYSIEMLSSDFDTYLRLEDDAGNQLAFDDDSGGSLNARIDFTPTRTGQYRIYATSYRPVTGRYNLIVRTVGASPVAGPIALELMGGAGKVTGDLTAKDEFDAVRTQSYRKVYQVNLAARQPYTISLTSADVDSYLRVEDETGRQIAYDDDGGGDRNSRLNFVPPTSGRYRIVVTTFHARATGSFTLTVQQAGP